LPLWVLRIVFDEFTTAQSNCTIGGCLKEKQASSFHIDGYILDYSTRLTPPHQHIASFDGIRGFSVLWVIAFHIWSNALIFVPQHTLSRALMGFISHGWLGVQIFFTLSGFLITGILYDALGSEHFFRNFYIRRVLRIFPLYYFVLIVLLCLTPLFALNWHGKAWAWFLYLQFTLNTSPYLSRHVSIVHFWSLAIEEQFYLCWPLIVYLIKNRNRLVVTAALLSLVALALRCYIVLPHASSSVRFLLPTEMDSLLIGGIGALLLHTRLRPQLLSCGKYLLAVSLIPLLWCLYTNGSLNFETDRFVDSLGFTLFATASLGLLLWALSPGSIAARLFSSSTLRFFGRYSYGLYILHYFLMALMLPLYHVVWRFTHQHSLALLIPGVVMIGGSLMLALLSFYLLEKPFLRLKGRFAYRKKDVTVLAFQA
jgi:peptidoglycan/LPS O-acetylase OafA/YrhL